MQLRSTTRMSMTDCSHYCSISGSLTFTCDQRWLEISVRVRGSTGAFTALSPRSELGPEPYALYFEPVITFVSTPEGAFQLLGCSLITTKAPPFTNLRWREGSH